MTAAQTQSAPTRKKLRVAWIASQGTLETFGRTLNPLAVGLLDELVDLTAVCPHLSDCSSLPSPPVQIVTHGRLQYWLWRTAQVSYLADQLRRRKVHLLHGLDVTTTKLTGQLAEQLGIPFVLSSYRIGDAKRIEKAARGVARVLAASEPIHEGVLSHRGFDSERVRLVRPGVYPARHATCFDDLQTTTSIVAAGRLDDAVPYEAMLHSFAELQHRNYDCAFFVIGGGHGENRLRRRAAELGVHQDVTFVEGLGSIALSEVFRAGDLFISPHATDDFDVPALLAMAAGVPVLATPQRACDFLIDGQTATLFSPGDASELTMKLIALLDDRAGARAMAESALGYLREHHGAAKMVSVVAETYRDAVG